MGHWYDKEGKPCHYQDDGKDTTLRHARKQDLVPSVTGILDIVSKPGLTRYFIDQHLEAAWVTNSALGKSEWMSQSRITAGEHAKQAREKGTEIHHAIESHYMNEGRYNPDMYDPELIPYVSAVTAALKEVYGVEGGVPERTFSTEAYGGSIDLVSDDLVVDFKFKSGGWENKKDGTPKKMWYDEHIAQLAAYANGIGLPDATVANVFIGPEAQVYIKEWTKEELERGLAYFNACNVLWKLKNNF